MVLDAFATSADMAERSQGSVPADTPFLNTALKAASTRIRNKCGWHVWPVVTDTYMVRELSGSQIWLPTTLMRSLSGLTVDGVAADLSLVRWFPDGRVDVCWAGQARVTFTHGYDEAPDDLIALTLDLALGDLLSRGVVREQTLASSVTWARTSGRITLEDEEILSAYKVGYVP